MGWQKEVSHLVEMARCRVGCRPRARLCCVLVVLPPKNKQKNSTLATILRILRDLAPCSHSKGVGNNWPFRFSLRRASSSLLLLSPLPPCTMALATATEVKLFNRWYVNFELNQEWS